MKYTLSLERKESTDLLQSELPKCLIYSTNKIYSGVHYSKRKQIKDSYLWWFKSLKVKKPKTPISCKNIKFVFEFKKRAFDCDNCSFMSKMIIDCLVKEKFFLDDTPKYIESITIKSFKGCKDFLSVSYYI